ncbi:MAG: S41 family peptidase [Verrucomicrobiales bacterium]
MLQNPPPALVALIAFCSAAIISWPASADPGPVSTANEPTRGSAQDGADATSTSSPESGFDEIELFYRVIEVVRQNYVDKDAVTYEKLIGSALQGMLAGLDPHSQFMQKPIFEQLKKSTGSTYDGVGITIALKTDVLTIVAVREDGPAARSGVLAGDQVLRINDIAADKIGLSEAIALLKGKPGKTLSLTLRRPANKELFEVEMVREIIQRDTVKGAKLLPKSVAGPYRIGYIRLLQFNSPTANQLAQQLDYLEGKGMEAFILDLRNNPGGLLGSAIDVCGEFVDPETLVLTTEGRPEVTDITPYYTAEEHQDTRHYPMAILVNHGSASGAEVVAGALQDLHRAIIVGTTTFGKGSVQSIMPMGRGTAIRLTTAKYYTPSKKTIHENGVTPNIVVSLTPSEEAQLARWRRLDELDEEEKLALKRFRDHQLIRAADALKGALVYQDLDKKHPPAARPPAAKAKPGPKAKLPAKGAGKAHGATPSGASESAP